jgi:hypothetical protein
MADIRSLVALHHARLDWTLLEEYFVLFGLGDIVSELRRLCGPAQ